MTTVHTDALRAQSSSPNNTFTFKPSGPGAGLLAIFVAKASTAYVVEEFRTQWPGRSFRLSKGSDQYNVFVCRQGLNHQCDCAGFSYGHGRACKHVLAMQAIIDRGLIAPLPAEPKPAPVAKPAHNPAQQAQRCPAEGETDANGRYIF